MMELIFEISQKDRRGFFLPRDEEASGNPLGRIPAGMLRKTDPCLPELSEVDVVRHFTKLSRRNFGVDSGFYPLGSCTMKYNPKINENIARLEGLKNLHPLQPDETVQGALEILCRLEQFLGEITGMDKVSLQPAAGAHGEMAGLMIIRAYHDRNKETQRTKVLCPDSAHGTNPASAAMAGFDVVQIKSNREGLVDVAELEKAMDKETAGLMLTNPNTLGLFEKEIIHIAKIVHERGGLLYYDGANANAILGMTRPGDMGFDVVHLNLHKTFSTPHGGGGPGAGPIGVKSRLAPFLPAPLVEEKDGCFRLVHESPHSIGRIRSFYGNFLVLVRAYAYILSMGRDGLKQVSEHAVLNANYLLSLLKDTFTVPYNGSCMHEFVLSGEKQKAKGVSTLDMAKRLLDYGVHPPTIYFPLIVKEALMIEPTETEGKETLDDFVRAMERIAREAEEDPDTLHGAPHTTPVGRLDEVRAARNLVLRWQEKKE
ncbi:MAG: aminomethyl-transferring glycine dehydrogenase subunit GcvPB [Clostridia bacterium]